MIQEIKAKSEMLAQLNASLTSLSPVVLTMREISARIGDTGYDAVVEANWDDEKAAFAIECRRPGNCFAKQGSNLRPNRSIDLLIRSRPTGSGVSCILRSSFGSALGCRLNAPKLLSPLESRTPCRLVCQNV